MLKEITTKDEYGYEENALTMEHYNAISLICDHWIGYCYNSLTPFARAEQYTDGYYGSLTELHKDSFLLYKNEDGIRRIETECPKIAWGFTAFIMTHVEFDTKNRPRFKTHRKEVSLSVLMEEYLSSQKTNHYILNEEDYKYNSINGFDNENRTLDITFYESHINQENDLISRTEQQGNNIAKGFISYSKDYIQFIEQELRRLNVVNFSNTEATKQNICNSSQYSKELLDLFHNHTELIDKLIGLSDDDIARQIKQWAKEKDKFGKPLIENPDNNLKSKFAKELKNAGIIRQTSERFRTKL